MQSREDAVKLITQQLSTINSNSKHEPAREKAGKFHYGKQDLRELLDFIYDSTPKDKSEEIA